MPSALWTSVLTGLALGALNAAAAYALYRVGRRRDPKAFLSIVLGGMVARLLVVTAVIGLVLLLLPVDRLAFTGGFLVAFALGTAAEVAILQRHAAHPQP